MVEEFNLRGKWWLPDKEKEKFQGSLAFSQEHKRGVLSINSEIDFEISEMGNRTKNKHEIILGETSEGQGVTLIDCEIIGFCLIKAENILQGAYFKRSQDIIFSSICITYRGDQINKWLERANRQARIESRNSIQARINDNYIINILPKPRLRSSSEQVQKESSEELLCVQIESLKVKTLEEYFKVNLVIFDFLNFIIPKEEVHIESIYGIREQREDLDKDNSMKSQEEKGLVEIFYKSAISRMFKPKAKTQPLFPYNQSQLDLIQNLFQKYLSEWFGLHEKPAVQLYCAVMSNPEMYDVYLFLALAQAIESYHATFIETESQEKKKKKEKINELARELSDEKKKELEGLIRHCFHPNFVDRIKDVYREYSNVADTWFTFKGEEDFSVKVKDTRNYLTHWTDRKETVDLDYKLMWLTWDLQLLLQLCILTRLGFTKEDIAKAYL